MIQFIKKLQKKRGNQKGFTLIELIVVIAILGILAAIAVPKFGDITERAQKTADTATARTIAAAVIMYQADKGDMTAEPSLDELSGFLEDTNTLKDTDGAEWYIQYDEDVSSPENDGKIYAIKKGGSSGTQYYPPSGN